MERGVVARGTEELGRGVVDRGEEELERGVVDRRAEELERGVVELELLCLELRLQLSGSVALKGKHPRDWYQL